MKTPTATTKGASLDPSSHSVDTKRQAERAQFQAVVDAWAPLYPQLVQANAGSSPVPIEPDASPSIPPPSVSGIKGTSRERSLANLRPFKPGQSGNPSGRPKGIVAKALMKELRRKIPGGDETVLKAYARKYVEEAIKECDAARFNSIRDTVDGRPGANDGDSANVGTVNILLGDAIPWMQGPAPQSPQTSQPMSLPDWAQTSGESPITVTATQSKADNGTLAERVGNGDQPTHRAPSREVR